MNDKERQEIAQNHPAPHGHFSVKGRTVVCPICGTIKEARKGWGAGRYEFWQLECGHIKQFTTR